MSGGYLWDWSFIQLFRILIAELYLAEVLDLEGAQNLLIGFTFLCIRDETIALA